MSELAIEVRDVSYSYPDGFVALDDLNFRVMRGERIAIVGPNGAGKSTLLMLLSGLYGPSRGHVFVLGLPANEKNSYRIRKRVGLVFQDPDDQLFNPTVWEDVAYGPLNLGLKREETSARARDALRMMRLEGFEDKPPHHLSAGQKKRAAMATVLAMRPEILLLDEPTVNLDPRSRSELLTAVDGLCENLELTLVVATHDTNFLPGLVDRIIVLNGGRIVTEGTVREIFLNSRILREANLEPPIIAQLFDLIAIKNKQVALDKIPLTLGEALCELDRLVGSGKPSPKKSS